MSKPSKPRTILDEINSVSRVEDIKSRKAYGSMSSFSMPVKKRAYSFKLNGVINKKGTKY